MNQYIKNVICILLAMASCSAEAAMHNSEFDKHWIIGVELGTSISVNGDTAIPSIFGKPPLKSEPVYKAGYLLGIHSGYQIQKWLIGEAEFNSMTI